MIEALIFILLTALASILHGGDYLPKAAVLSCHAILVLVACGPLYLPWVPFWWYHFRRSWHARAELDYITGISPLSGVESAYGMPIGLVAREVVEYCHHNRWPWISERRQQELLLALLVTAPICTIVPLVMGVFL